MRASWLVLLGMVGCIAVLPGLHAQEQPEGPAELPPGAAWRWGRQGDTPDTNGIYRLAFAPDGSSFAARDRENRVLVVDAQTRRTLCEIEGHREWVQSVVYSPDSRRLVTAAGPGEEVKVWEASTGKLLDKLDVDALLATFDPREDRLHLLGETHVITYSWPGLQLEGQRKWQTGTENRLGMSRDGRQVVLFRMVSQRVYQTLVMDLENRSKVQLDGPPGQPRSCVISPDGNWLAVNYNRDPRTRVWDLRDPHNRKFVLDGHDEPVQTLAISPDSRFLLTTGWDDRSILWELASQTPISQQRGHSENVNASAFHPQQLLALTGASGRSDCSVLAWDLSADILPPELEQPELSFAATWEGLGLQDFRAARQHVARLVRRGADWDQDLRARILESVAVKTSGEVTRLIEKLDDPRFQIREEATLALIQIRLAADSQLRLAAENEPSPEVRARLQRILRHAAARPPVDLVEHRRWLRLLLALEWMDSPTSLELLQQIANGHADVDLAREATAVVARRLASTSASD